MNVYRLKNEDPDRFDSLLLSGGKYDSLYFFGKRARGWKPVGVKIYKMRQRADLYDLAGNPVASDKAWKVLRALLSSHVQGLPIRLGAQELQLLNVTEMSSSFDERKSKVERFSDGGIMRVERYAFDTKRISSPIFRLKGLEAHGVFCTDDLRELVEHHGLHGWGFEQVAGSTKALSKARPKREDAVSLRDALVEAASSRGAKRMTNCVSNVYHATVLDREVLNGGFSQYLWNTRGKALPSARSAFEQLDVPTAASLLDEVISLWSSRKSEHSGFFRSGVFGARSPLANGLDKFSGRYSRLRADLAILNYVDAHVEEIKRWVR